jgi:hypothetical protein
MLLTTVFARESIELGSTASPVVAITGFVGGFAERLVPSLVQRAANSIGDRAGTASQAAASESNASSIIIAFSSDPQAPHDTHLDISVWHRAVLLTLRVQI